MLHLGVLERESVTEATRQDYANKLEQFKRSARLRDLNIPPDILDAKLVKFFGQGFLAGDSYTHGEKVWAAVRFYVPSFASHGHLHLPRSARSLKGWRKLCPTKTRRPLPWDIAAAVAWNLLLTSTGMCIAWLLMLDTYMRPGECLELTCEQVLPPTHRWPMLKAAILLHPDQRAVASKTGELNESLVVSRAWLSAALMEVIAARRRRAQLWDFSMVQFRTAFLLAAREVGIEKWKPCLYMARHTGASLDRLEDRLPLAEVQRRGRWKSEKSVRRYEKRALVQEVYTSLTPQQQASAKRRADQLESALLRAIRSSR